MARLAAAPHAHDAAPIQRMAPQEAHNELQEARQSSDEEEAGTDHALIEDEYLRADLESFFGEPKENLASKKAAQETSIEAVGEKPAVKQEKKQPAAKRTARVRKPKPETTGKEKGEDKCAPKKAPRATKASKAAALAALKKEADPPPHSLVKEEAMMLDISDDEETNQHVKMEPYEEEPVAEAVPSWPTRASTRQTAARTVGKPTDPADAARLQDAPRSKGDGRGGSPSHGRPTSLSTHRAASASDEAGAAAATTPSMISRVKGSCIDMRGVPGSETRDAACEDSQPGGRSRTKTEHGDATKEATPSSPRAPRRRAPGRPSCRSPSRTAVEQQMKEMRESTHIDTASQQRRGRSSLSPRLVSSIVATVLAHAPMRRATSRSHSRRRSDHRATLRSRSPRRPRSERRRSTPSPRRTRRPKRSGTPPDDRRQGRRPEIGGVTEEDPPWRKGHSTEAAKKGRRSSERSTAAPEASPWATRAQEDAASRAVVQFLRHTKLCDEGWENGEALLNQIPNLPSLESISWLTRHSVSEAHGDRLEERHFGGIPHYRARHRPGTAASPWQRGVRLGPSGMRLRGPRSEEARARRQAASMRARGRN